MRVNNNYLKILALVSLFLYQCNFINSNLNDLDKEISEQLKECSLNNVVSCKKDKDTLNIKISYLHNNELSDSITYFLDEESNNLIVSLICFKNNDKIKRFEEVHFNLFFEDKSDKMVVKLNKEKLNEEYLINKNNPLFYKFVEYSLINMRYLGVLSTHQMLIFLDRESSVINYKGSFWEFLYDYSFAINSSNYEAPIISNFIWFVNICNESEFYSENFYEDYFPKPLLYFVSSCGFNENVFKIIDPEEISSYIEGNVPAKQDINK